MYQPPVAKESPAPARSAIQLENVVEVTSIDEPHQTITGTDRFGSTFTFHYRPLTKVHRLSPFDETLTLESLTSAGEPFPIIKDQEVLVHWVPEDRGKTRVAMKLTILE